jgi:hypothetical protein
MSVEIDWIPQGGQIIHNKLQLEVDPALSAPVAGVNKILKISVTDYPNSMWRDEMTKEGFLVCMDDIQLSILKLELGTKFNSRSHNRCSSTRALEDLHEYKIGKYFSRKNRVFIKMLRNACTNVKPSRDLKILIRLLFTKEMDEILAGSRWNPEWTEKPWLMPAMRLWAKILLRFEGLNDAANTNFVFDLGTLMAMSTGKDAKSVQDIMSRTEKLLVPVSQNFGDVQSFVKFLIACVGAEEIH